MESGRIVCCGLYIHIANIKYVVEIFALDGLNVKNLSKTEQQEDLCAFKCVYALVSISTTQYLYLEPKQN